MRKAFTLIELLVVVAIIALLISILLPSLTSARETARIVACLSQKKQFYAGYSMYADAWENMHTPVKFKGGSGTPYGPWQNNVSFRQMVGTGTAVSPLTTLLKCPNRPEPPYFTSSMGPNWKYLRRNNVTPGWGAELIVRRPLIVNPSGKVGAVDLTDWHIGSKNNINPALKWDIWGETKNNTLAYRHKDGAVALMLDGSGRWFSKPEMFPSNNTTFNRLWDIYRK
jgi:prepilin-type N-terminal cleavage/methylation domain-containing protein